LNWEYDYFVKNDMLRLLIRLARYKFIAKQISSKDCVLEVGCGSGLGSVFLGQHCKSVLGIDLNESEIQEARKINRRRNVKFETGDIFDYHPFAKFDVLVALDVIEHLPPADGKKLVNVLSSLVNDKGMVIIGTPSIYSYPHQGELSKAAHVKCYDLDELCSVVGKYFHRILRFSMNDEIVHTGHPKMAWYYFLLCFMPKNGSSKKGKTHENS
jgi:2-polyprenyl-3-methyl-5-hydroxy-6-metoxy-1,4-benzoquinol methylase